MSPLHHVSFESPIPILSSKVQSAGTKILSVSIIEKALPECPLLLAHDDKLWVVAPGLKFVHPGGTGLNDLELLEVFVPVSVGSPYDVLGF